MEHFWDRDRILNWGNKQQMSWRLKYWSALNLGRDGDVFIARHFISFVPKIPRINTTRNLQKRLLCLKLFQTGSMQRHDLIYKPHLQL